MDIKEKLHKHKAYCKLLGQARDLVNYEKTVEIAGEIEEQIIGEFEELVSQRDQLLAVCKEIHSWAGRPESETKWNLPYSPAWYSKLTVAIRRVEVEQAQEAQGEDGGA